jgi:hypothetical protein
MRAAITNAPRDCRRPCARAFRPSSSAPCIAPWPITMPTACEIAAVPGAQHADAPLAPIVLLARGASDTTSAHTGEGRAAPPSSRPEGQALAVHEPAQHDRPPASARATASRRSARRTAASAAKVERVADREAEHAARGEERPATARATQAARERDPDREQEERERVLEEVRRRGARRPRRLPRFSSARRKRWLPKAQVAATAERGDRGAGSRGRPSRAPSAHAPQAASPDARNVRACASR